MEPNALNPIEKLMVDKSTTFKLAVATTALVLVLWASGSPTQSLWITPVIILVAWIGVQSLLRYRRRHRHV